MEICGSLYCQIFCILLNSSFMKKYSTSRRVSKILFKRRVSLNYLTSFRFYHNGELRVLNTFLAGHTLKSNFTLTSKLV